MRAEKFWEVHPVVLMVDEVDERAREAAGLLLAIKAKKAEIELHDEAAKTKKKQLADEEKALTNRAFDLGQVVKSRREPRQVECQETLRGTMIITTRLDTGEEVGSRAATKMELQEELPLLIPGGGAKKAEKTEKKSDN